MPVYADLELHQGDDILFRLELLDSDRSLWNVSSGYTGRATFKKTYATRDSDAYNFTVTFPGDPVNAVDLVLDGTVSDDIKSGRYVYDVFLLKDNSSVKVLEGKLEIYPSATSIV